MFNRDLAMMIIRDDDAHEEHPDSRDTMEAMRFLAVDMECEKAKLLSSGVRCIEE